MWEAKLIIFDSAQILFLRYIRSTDSRNIRNTITIVFTCIFCYFVLNDPISNLAKGLVLKSSLVKAIHFLLLLLIFITFLSFL